MLHGRFIVPLISSATLEEEYLRSRITAKRLLEEGIFHHIDGFCLRVLNLALEIRVLIEMLIERVARYFTRLKSFLPRTTGSEKVKKDGLHVLCELVVFHQYILLVRFNIVI